MTDWWNIATNASGDIMTNSAGEIVLNGGDCQPCTECSDCDECFKINFSSPSVVIPLLIPTTIAFPGVEGLGPVEGTTPYAANASIPAFVFDIVVRPLGANQSNGGMWYARIDQCLTATSYGPPATGCTDISDQSYPINGFDGLDDVDSTPGSTNQIEASIDVIFQIHNPPYAPPGAFFSPGGGCINLYLFGLIPCTIPGINAYFSLDHCPGLQFPLPSYSDGPQPTFPIINQQASVYFYNYWAAVSGDSAQVGMPAANSAKGVAVSGAGTYQGLLQLNFGGEFPTLNSDSSGTKLVPPPIIIDGVPSGYGEVPAVPVTITVTKVTCNTSGGTVSTPCTPPIPPPNTNGGCVPANCSAGCFEIFSFGPRALQGGTGLNSSAIGIYTAPSDGTLTFYVNYPDNTNASGGFVGSFGSNDIAVWANGSGGASIPVVACTSYSYTFTGTAIDGAGTKTGADGTILKSPAGAPCSNAPYGSLVAVLSCPGVPCDVEDTTSALYLEFDAYYYYYNSSSGLIQTYSLGHVSGLEIDVAGSNLWTGGSFSWPYPLGGGGSIAGACRLFLTNDVPFNTSSGCAWVLHLDLDSDGYGINSYNATEATPLGGYQSADLDPDNIAVITPYTEMGYNDLTSLFLYAEGSGQLHKNPLLSFQNLVVT